MALIVKESKKDFEVPEEGLYSGAGCDVRDLGMVTTQFGESHKVLISIQIDQKDSRGRFFVVAKRYTLSLHAKANLRRDLETWRGARFRPEELENGFDLEKLIDAPCQVQIAHNVKDDGATYANIQAIIPPAKGQARHRVQDYVRFQDRDKQQGTGNGNVGEVDDEIVPF